MPNSPDTLAEWIASFILWLTQALAAMRAGDRLSDSQTGQITGRIRGTSSDNAVRDPEMAAPLAARPDAPRRRLHPLRRMLRAEPPAILAPAILTPARAPPRQTPRQAESAAGPQPAPPPARKPPPARGPPLPA